MRHGTCLILRNINWKITNGNRKTPILGRIVLETLESDNRDVLFAARDRVVHDIDISENLNQDESVEESEDVNAALNGECVLLSIVHDGDDGPRNEKCMLTRAKTPLKKKRQNSRIR